jgi:hypothetical protein
MMKRNLKDYNMQKDTFTWHVEYKDGATLHEHDGIDSPGRGFAEVDQAQVKTVVLSLPTLPPQPMHHVVIPEDASPVFFRRRRIELNPNTGKQTQMTIHCIGWRNGNHGIYLFACDDGSTLLTSDFNAI